MPSPLPDSQPPQRFTTCSNAGGPDGEDQLPQSKHSSAKTKFKHAGIWLVIGLVAFTGVSFKDEFTALGSRLLSELLPHRGATVGDQISFRSAHGSSHFVIEAEVDGTPLRFLADTGATDVVISTADARQLGIDPSTLRFDKIYRTANGIVRGAPITLKEIRVGPITLKNVRASVNGAPLNRSLLGMSFIGRLSSYSVSGDRLTLKR